MPKRSIDIDRLVLSIHSASLSPQGWRTVSRDLMGVLGARAALMHGVVMKPGGPAPWGVLEEFDPSCWREFADRWVDQDLWRVGAQRTGRVHTGCVSLGEQLVDRREFVTSSYYNDFLKRADLDRLLNVCLSSPYEGDPFASALSFYRGIGKEGFSAADAGFLGRIAPHLVVAARNFFQAQSLQLVDAMRQDALDAVVPALLAVDALGHVVFSNRAGEEALRDGSFLRSSSGVLAAGPAVREAAPLARAMEQLRQGVGASLLLTDARTNVQMIMTAAPARRPALLGTVAGLVWLLPTLPDTSPVRVAARLFRLTAAEQRLLARLITGEDVYQAAESLGISRHTARTQLISIFDKTERRSQSHLLQLMSQIAAIRIPT